MNFFKELWIQGKLTSKRNPMFEKNRFAKVWIYIGVGFWACYLIFLGVVFALGFSEGGRESYQVLNSGLIIFLVIDFLIRFPFQQTPTQEVKPYLLMPVRKKRIVDFLLIRSGLDMFNLFWFFFFVPFACFALFRFFGITGIIGYLIGIWLLIIINNYWFLLCRTLINEKVWWILLPASFYGAIAAALFIPKHSILMNWFIDLGDGFIQFNILFFLAAICLIVCLWFINSRMMSSQIYKEINKVDDIKIKHLSEYKFLDRFGMIGEFSRLELKMLFRNRATKISMRMILILIIMFVAIQSFTQAYNDKFGKIFIIMYAFCAVGITLLLQIMAFEGNYIDGLMVRKECILSLLKAKYYLSCLYTIIPFIILIPSMVMGKITILFALSMDFFCIGLIYFILFQLAVYNMQTVPLNKKLAGRQSTSSTQKLISFLVFLVPIASFEILDSIFGDTIGQTILLIIGAGFVFTSDIWLRNIYKRFMKRRYQNMESFHDSRNNN